MRTSQKVDSPISGLLVTSNFCIHYCESDQHICKKVKAFFGCRQLTCPDVTLDLLLLKRATQQQRTPTNIRVGPIDNNITPTLKTKITKDFTTEILGAQCKSQKF